MSENEIPQRLDTRLASIEELLTKILLTVKDFAENGMQMQRNAELGLDEGEIVETANGYVFGKTKKKEPVIWLYDFPRQMKTGAVYQEYLEELPFQVNQSRQWPVATAPTWDEAMEEGSLFKVPRFKFVRTPTGALTDDGKVITKFTRCLTPQAAQSAAQPPQATQTPQGATQPPQATTQPPQATTQATAQASQSDKQPPKPPQAGIDEKRKEAYEAFERAIIKVFGDQETDAIIKWMTYRYTSKLNEGKNITDNPDFLTAEDFTTLTPALARWADTYLELWATHKAETAKNPYGNKKAA